MNGMPLSTVAQRSILLRMSAEEDIKEFGRLIRAKRERMGISPQAFATAISRSDSYVSRLEKGKIATPPPEVAGHVTSNAKWG
jgi:ribosome-binding protein aMBF1 (putative translation factor)